MNLSERERLNVQESFKSISADIMGVAFKRVEKYCDEIEKMYEELTISEHEIYVVKDIIKSIKKKANISLESFIEIELNKMKTIGGNEYETITRRVVKTCKANTVIKSIEDCVYFSILTMRDVCTTHKVQEMVDSLDSRSCRVTDLQVTDLFPNYTVLFDAANQADSYRRLIRITKENKTLIRQSIDRYITNEFIEVFQKHKVTGYSGLSKDDKATFNSFHHKMFVTTWCNILHQGLKDDKASGRVKSFLDYIKDRSEFCPRPPVYGYEMTW